MATFRSARASVALLFVSACALAGCNASNPTAGLRTVAEAPPVKFSEKEYGVSASPRVALSGADFVKGGGHYKVGKPYKVRGVWYTPKEDFGYRRDGKASWYGPNFHGRKTANGEIFDQHHLSAAHPTFPLPSYARVTNLKNGRSVVVRVNDRGPYSHSRLIDLSKRAAEVLKFKQAGTAPVRVEYVGRAPLEGDDMPRLLATIDAPADSTSTMMASAPVPTAVRSSALAFSDEVRGGF